ncbi:MAG: 3'-5' exonuclease, partial [Bacteroidota bacterium]
MNYVIFDLEATCWEYNFDDRLQETIEIGAFLLTPFGEIVGEYNRFIRPKLYPDLSVYCKELTSITQEEINRALPFDQVIEEFQD